VFNDLFPGATTINELFSTSSGIVTL
jgi:hypothetical protein